VLTLALGIDAICAVFSLVQGVLPTPPPLSATGPLQWTEWQKEAKSAQPVAR